MSRVFLVAGLAGVLLSNHPATAQEPPAPVADDAVLAMVNGQPVRAGQYRSTYFAYLVSTGRNDTPETRHAHLNSLIDTYLLAEEARRQGLEDDPDFRDFADRRIRQIVGSRYFERAVLGHLPRPSDAEVRQAYRRSHETRRLRHLFFRDRDRAQAAYERLQAGEDFVRLANEVFRTARFDSTAGLLGAAAYWDLDDAVAEAAYATPVGHYTLPVRSRFGWHIVRVEERVYNPVLLESDFEAHRDKVAARLRQRQYRIEGDRFIREMMSGTDLEMNAEAVNLLAQAIRRISGGAEIETVDVALLDEEVAQIREVLTPETVLASYTFDGRQYTLTAGTYYRWLADLPGREVRTNTAASIGRVLRDEVLAERGFAEGLERDGDVLHDLHHVTSDYLARRLSENLRADTSITPTEAELHRAFAALGYDRIETATADFWMISFDSLDAAARARQQLEAGVISPPDYASYRLHEGADLASLGALGPHVRMAPLNQTVLLGQADGTWILLHVDARRLDRNTFEESRTRLTSVLKPHLAQMRLLDRLRAVAEIDIDRGVFDVVLLPKRPVAAGMPPEE